MPSNHILWARCTYSCTCIHVGVYSKPGGQWVRLICSASAPCPIFFNALMTSSHLNPGVLFSFLSSIVVIQSMTSSCELLFCIPSRSFSVKPKLTPNCLHWELTGSSAITRSTESEKQKLIIQVVSCPGLASVWLLPTIPQWRETVNELIATLVFILYAHMYMYLLCNRPTKTVLCYIHVSCLIPWEYLQHLWTTLCTYPVESLQLCGILIDGTIPSSVVGGARRLSYVASSYRQ